MDTAAMPADADIAYIRDTTSEIIPLCQECSAFLTIEDNPELAKELSIHGVHLTKGGRLQRLFTSLTGV